MCLWERGVPSAAAGGPAAGSLACALARWWSRRRWLEPSTCPLHLPLSHTHTHHPAAAQVRTAHKVQASLVVVLTRGGATARLVAKYRPTVPILTVVVPVLTTDNLTWQCSSEAPARQCLSSRGLVPILAEGSARWAGAGVPGGGAVPGGDAGVGVAAGVARGRRE